jgi:hypothetical protein
MGQVNIFPKAPKKRARIWHNSFHHMHVLLRRYFKPSQSLAKNACSFQGNLHFPNHKRVFIGSDTPDDTPVLSHNIILMQICQHSCQMAGPNGGAKCTHQKHPSTA